MKRNGKYHPVNAYTKWMKMFSEDLKRKRKKKNKKSVKHWNAVVEEIVKETRRI